MRRPLQQTTSAKLLSSPLISYFSFRSSFLNIIIHMSKKVRHPHYYQLFFHLQTIVSNSEYAVFLHQITRITPLSDTWSTFLLHHHLLTCVIQWGTEEGKWNNFMLEANQYDTQDNEMDDFSICQHRSMRAQKKSFSPLMWTVCKRREMMLSRQFTFILYASIFWIFLHISIPTPTSLTKLQVLVTNQKP